MMTPNDLTEWQTAARAQIESALAALEAAPAKPAALRDAEAAHSAARKEHAAATQRETSAIQAPHSQGANAPTPDMKRATEAVAAASKKMRDAFEIVLAERRKYGPQFLKDIGPAVHDGRAIMLELIGLLESMATAYARVDRKTLDNGLPRPRLLDRSGRLAQTARECRALIEN